MIPNVVAAAGGNIFVGSFNDLVAQYHINNIPVDRS